MYLPTEWEGGHDLKSLGGRREARLTETKWGGGHGTAFRKKFKKARDRGAV